MKRKIYHSFRFEFLICALFSLLAAVLAEAGIIAVGYIIYGMINTLPEGLGTAAASGYGGEAYNHYINNSINSRIIEESFEKTSAAASTGIGGSAAAFAVLLLIFLGIGIFILCFLILTKKFSNYLEEIAGGIRRFSAGNFEIKIHAGGNNELAEIAENLNRMAEGIKDRIDNERDAESKKNALITSVAHDLRTPLTSIIGYLDLVSNKSLEEERREKYISIAYSKSKRLEHLIEDLFTYTKLDFGEIRLSLTEVDIIKMMEQMIDEFYPRFQENSLDYSFEHSDKSILIKADAALLGRAFANLFENAIKYGADGKDILIRAEKREQSVHVEITNYGEIIPKEDLENIFTKFFRVESSRNVVTGGTGLGLTITKNIIKYHKGDIQVKSDLNGTAFKVSIPINDTHAESI